MFVTENQTIEKIKLGSLAQFSNRTVRQLKPGKLHSSIHKILK